jgi:hypothetical protein
MVNRPLNAKSPRRASLRGRQPPGAGSGPKLRPAPGAGASQPCSPVPSLPTCHCGRKKGTADGFKSSGCAAFGYPAAVPRIALRQPPGGDLGGKCNLCVPHSARRRLAFEADALVEHDRFRLRLKPRWCPLRQRSDSFCELLAFMTRQPRETAASPARCRTVTGRRSCYDRASRTKLIAAPSCRFATP